MDQHCCGVSPQEIMLQFLRTVVEGFLHFVSVAGGTAILFETFGLQVDLSTVLPAAAGTALILDTVHKQRLYLQRNNMHLRSKEVVLEAKLLRLAEREAEAQEAIDFLDHLSQRGAADCACDECEVEECDSEDTTETQDGECCSETVDKEEGNTKEE